MACTCLRVLEMQAMIISTYLRGSAVSLDRKTSPEFVHTRQQVREALGSGFVEKFKDEDPAAAVVCVCPWVKSKAYIAAGQATHAGGVWQATRRSKGKGLTDSMVWHPACQSESAADCSRKKNSDDSKSPALRAAPWIISGL